MRNHTVSRYLYSSSYSMCGSFIVTRHHPHVDALSMKPCDDVCSVAAHDVAESNAASHAAVPPNPNVRHDGICFNSGRGCSSGAAALLLQRNSVPLQLEKLPRPQTHGNTCSRVKDVQYKISNHEYRLHHNHLMRCLQRQSQVLHLNVREEGAR